MIQRKPAQEKTEAWDGYLHAGLLFVYRKDHHAYTGLRTGTHLFSRPIKGPLEVLIGTWTDDRPTEPVVYASRFVEELKQTLELGWKLE